VIHRDSGHKTFEKELETPTRVVLATGCPHPYKEWLQSEGIPYAKAKALLDSLSISVDLQVDCGDNGSLQHDGNETAQDEADEIAAIANNIAAGYTNKLIGGQGNHLFQATDFQVQVWDEYDLSNFDHELILDSNAEYEFQHFGVRVLNDSSGPTNILHLWISDQNWEDFPYGGNNVPVGEESQAIGGKPTGCCQMKSIQWIQEMMVKYHDHNITLNLHQGVAESTLATGYGESTVWHNPKPIVISDGGGNMFAIIDRRNSGYVDHQYVTWFKDVNRQNDSGYRTVFQRHTHTCINESYLDRGWRLEESNCLYLNIGALAIHHGSGIRNQYATFTTMEYREGSNVAVIRRYSVDGQNDYGVNVPAGEVDSFRMHYRLRWPHIDAYTAPTLAAPSAVVGSTNTSGSDTELTWAKASDLVMILHNPSVACTVPDGTNMLYPIGYLSDDGDRVVYIGDGESWTDLGITGGNYLFVAINAGGGSFLLT